MSSLSKHQKNLPDLCLLALISQLTLVDRIAARQISPQWFHRTREANRAVRSLTITTGDIEVSLLEGMIDLNSHVNFAPSLRLLTLLPDDDGKSPAFPVHPRLTGWNCLALGSCRAQCEAKLQQITATFASLTELTFVHHQRFYNQLVHLVEMLACEHWKRQLVSLRVINECYFNDDDEVLVPLFSAVNSLPALRFLLLSKVKMHDLPVLAQLRQISVKLLGQRGAFFKSLQQYANEKISTCNHLSVQLLDEDIFANFGEIVALSGHLRERITCLSLTQLSAFNSHDNLPTICTSFPNLTSLSLTISLTQLNQTFLTLAALGRLLHLSLITSFAQQKPQEEFTLPQTQLPSVKALDLKLSQLASHFQLHWLNLAVTMPNLKAIHIELSDSCNQCSTKFKTNNGTTRDSVIKAQFVCLREKLQFVQKRTRIPLNRISYKNKYGHNCTADKLIVE